MKIKRYLNAPQIISTYRFVLTRKLEKKIQSRKSMDIKIFNNGFHDTSLETQFPITNKKHYLNH